MTVSVTKGIQLWVSRRELGRVCVGLGVVTGQGEGTGGELL